MTKLVIATVAAFAMFSSAANAACTCNTNDIPGPIRAKMIKELEKKKFSDYSVCMRTFGQKNVCFIEEARNNPQGFVKLLNEVQK